MIAGIGINALVVWPILFFSLGLSPAPFLPFLVVFLIALPSVAVPLFGPELLERGRRMRVEDAVTLMEKDPRPPVLYLRSFEDEDLVDPTIPMSLLSLIKSGPFMHGNRYEVPLTRTLRRLGPVICVGRPGEAYAERGAARLYVSHEDWQHVVEYFLPRSAAVVLVVGRTESLWWEVNATIARVPLERVLFFFPYAEEKSFRNTVRHKYLKFFFFGTGLVFTRKSIARIDADRQARYQLFRQRTRSLFPAPLPAELGTPQFLDFRPGGSPRLLPFVRTLTAAIMWRFYRISWTQINFRSTLKPFIEKIQGSRSQPGIDVILCWISVKWRNWCREVRSKLN
jgi:hypothetical protein